jgi:hypothetical protein
MENTFENAGEPWSQEEDNQLKKLYNEDMLELMEISKIHSRAPGGIISRLRKHGIISRYDKNVVRGYSAYQNSDLYKEKVSKKNEKKNKNKSEEAKKKIPTEFQTEDIIIMKDKNKDVDLQKDVKEMKKEIKELQKMIKEIAEMMKAVYEFEAD